MGDPYPQRFWPEGSHKSDHYTGRKQVEFHALLSMKSPQFSSRIHEHFFIFLSFESTEGFDLVYQRIQIYLSNNENISYFPTS